MRSYSGIYNKEKDHLIQGKNYLNSNYDKVEPLVCDTELFYHSLHIVGITIGM